MAQGLITLRGKDLYVQVSGPEDAPTLLYLHGGPGTGAYDFDFYQRERLSARLRLVTFDQRGVLRSAPLAPTEAFGVRDLVDDCEALRHYLGIERWSVLGHSFGGHLALKYALAYPDAIERLLFENPSFDFVSSLKSLLTGAAEQYTQLGQQAQATACLAAVAESQPTATLWETFTHLIGNLGERRNFLYVYGSEKDFFENLIAASPLAPELWQRATLHQQKLVEEGSIFESTVPDLARCHHPALLLQGKYDWVISQDQVVAFRDTKPNASIRVFEYSGHFVRFEEPDSYATAVCDFVLNNHVSV